MRNIRLTLAAVLVTFGAGAVASAQETTPAPQPHARHAGPGLGQKRFGGRDRNPFLRGITLSDAEKANLKTINAQHKAQMKALREQYKPQHEAMRAARQKGDTAALRSLFAQSKSERDQMRQLMESQRKDVRAALTPDNQSKFDTNVSTFEQRMAKRGAKAGGKGAKAGIKPE